MCYLLFILLISNIFKIPFIIFASSKANRLYLMNQHKPYIQPEFNRPQAFSAYAGRPLVVCMFSSDPISYTD